MIWPGTDARTLIIKNPKGRHESIFRQAVNMKIAKYHMTDFYLYYPVIFTVF